MFIWHSAYATLFCCYLYDILSLQFNLVFLKVDPVLSWAFMYFIAIQQIFVDEKALNYFCV